MREVRALGGGGGGFTTKQRGPLGTTDWRPANGSHSYPFCWDWRSGGWQEWHQGQCNSARLWYESKKVDKKDPGEEEKDEQKHGKTLGGFHSSHVLIVSYRVCDRLKGGAQ